MDKSPKGLRLLSFDGGGLRGLAGLLIVLEMMQRLMFDLELRKMPRPCEYFEMVAGSGTGGLSAILLGRLGFSVEDAIYQYIRIAKAAFSNVQIEPKERVEMLRKVLKDVLEDAGLEVDAMMEGTDTVAGKCKIFVCVSAVGDVSRSRLLRSYRGRAFHSPSCTIIDATLATLSSSGNFEPITIKGIGASEDFVDSDISCSNPTLELLREAADVFGSHILIFSIISLGSGRENADASSKEGTIGAAARDSVTIHTHFSIACERTHEDLQRRTLNLNIYFRFNPGRDISSSQTHEWKQVSFIKTQTTSYLQMEMVSQQLDSAINTLHSNPTGALLSTINSSSRPDARGNVPAHLRSQFEDNFDSHILTQQKTAPAQGAMHEKCLQGTRMPILERIRQWADSNQNSRPIFWLCDSAGTGKSTIAVTMGEEWGNSDRLAAQFCFSNSSASTSSPSLFFSTIAVDMASRIPELRSTIAGVFKNDPMLANRSLAEQFRKLILDPLKKLERDVILIIDAADECEASSRNSLLKLLVEQLPLVPRLQILITSRPEHDITPILEDSAVVHTVEFQLQTTEIDSNVNDISTYIHHHLSKILSEEQCQLLIRRANGLFIWASTAKRELDPSTAFEPTGDIFDRLMSSGGFGDLDSLYHKILERATPHHKYIDFVCQTLGLLLTIQEPLSIRSVEMFIPGKPVENLIRRLRSVLNFKTRDDPILFFHPTFREYLLASGRKTYIVNIPNSHLLVATKCFTFMQKELKHDMCGTGLSIGHLPNNKDNPGLLATLKSCVTIPLLYSTKYWFHHTEYCLENKEIIDRMLDFFQRNLLHWVEVLSLSNQLVIGMKGLGALRKGIRKAEGYSLNQSAQVEDWCNDTLQLIQTQQAVLEVNSFAIYAIITASAPREGIIYNYYGENNNGSTPKTLQGWRKRWPSHVVLSGHTYGVNSLVISNDGTMVASGSGDETIRMWDTVTGASLCDPMRHDTGVNAVAFYPDGSRVISGLDEGQLAEWNVTTGEALGPIFQEHYSAITRLAISPDGTRLVSASVDTTLRLWDANDLSITPLVIKGHMGRVNSVSFSPDGVLFASGSQDKTLRLWDGTTGASVGVPLQGHHGIVNCVAFSPTDATIVSSSSDHTLRLWSVERQRPVGGPIDGHSRCWCVSFSPDGTTIASGSDDNIIRLWSVATRELISQLRGHTNPIRCVAFLPEGNRIVSGSDDHTIRIWDLDFQRGEDEEIQEGHNGEIYGIAFSPCSSTIATCSADHTLRIWNAINGEFIGEMSGHTEEVNWVAFSPDGSTIASGSDDETIRLWDVNTRKCLKVVEGHTGWVYCVAFSHDGKKIISGSRDKTLRLWNAETGVRIGNHFYGHWNSISCVAFSPDDTKIVSGSYDRTVRLWSITGEKLQVYSNAHESIVKLAIFSTDNLYLLSACEDELAVWSISSSDNVARFPHFHPSLTNLLPSHIQHLKFDLTMTSGGYHQPGPIVHSVQRYFNDPHIMQVYFNHLPHGITLSNPSDYVFYVPADFRVNRWKGSGGIIVLVEYYGRIMMLDFSHLFT